MSTRLTIPVLVAAGLAAVVPWAGGRAADPAGDAADRVKAVRATYEKVPPDVLKLKEPIRVTQCSHQATPKVIILVFADAGGATHDFRWWLDPKPHANVEFDRIYWLRHEGVSRLGADEFRLAVRGPEEDALYGVLLRWAAGKEADKDRSAFDKLMLKEVTALLGKLDARFAEPPVARKW